MMSSVVLVGPKNKEEFQEYSRFSSIGILLKILFLFPIRNEIMNTSNPGHRADTTTAKRSQNKHRMPD